MGVMASQITGVLMVCSTVCSGADQRKQSSASLAFAREIHRWPVNSPHEGPVTRKLFPFDDVIMKLDPQQTIFGCSNNTKMWCFRYGKRYGKLWIACNTATTYTFMIPDKLWQRWSSTFPRRCSNIPTTLYNVCNVAETSMQRSLQHMDRYMYIYICVCVCRK